MNPEPTVSEPPAASFGSGARALHAARLFCELCQTSTPHRILRLDPGSTRESARIVSGIARCQVCRRTGPFRADRRPDRAVAAILSEGGRSSPTTIPLPDHSRIAVGDRVVVRPGQEALVRRIEGDRGPEPAASVRSVRRLWLSVPGPPAVPISIHERGRTRSVRWTYPPGATVAIGDLVSIDSESVEVVAIRIRGRTLRQSPQPQPLAEVTRLYGRRATNPPGGRSRGRSSRSMPSARDHSRSASARRRSSPGRISAWT